MYPTCQSEKLLVMFSLNHRQRESCSRKEWVMHVSNSGHSVNLEVLVWANGRGFLDGAPVGEGGLRIIKPLVAKLPHVSGVMVRDAFGDFRARHSAIEVKHLRSNLLHHIWSRLDRHQFVPEHVTGTNYLNFIDVVSVKSRNGDTCPIHLSGEHFIAEEPIAEDSTVAIRTV